LNFSNRDLLWCGWISCAKSSTSMVPFGALIYGKTVLMRLICSLQPSCNLIATYLQPR
jgi:hypothetical protein